MQVELTPEQYSHRARFREFVEREITPHAAEWDRRARLAPEIRVRLTRRGYLGAPLARDVGGGGMDPIVYGLLTEEIARGCSSVRTLLTVHDMTTLAISRWAKPALKERWLQHLSRGELLAAFAVTESEAGSDAARVRTSATPVGDDFVLNGTKKWISFGQMADLFLVLAHCDEKPTTFLLPANEPGLTVSPEQSIIGNRASMLASLEFENCRIPAESQVGRTGFGFSHVITSALDHGRFSVAWGALGIAQVCLDASLDYTSRRRQFGKSLDQHQLVQRKLTEMVVNTRAARLLCYRAAYLRSVDNPSAFSETMIAKYYASRTASQNALSTLHLHGAKGFTQELAVERYLRDAKVTEVIEGSNEIQQTTIPRLPLADL